MTTPRSHRLIIDITPSLDGTVDLAITTPDCHTEHNTLPYDPNVYLRAELPIMNVLRTICRKVEEDRKLVPPKK